MTAADREGGVPRDVCPHCEGDGFEMDRDGPYVCGVCHGRGDVYPERIAWYRKITATHTRAEGT